jgi:hypothetical protein
MGWTPHTHGIVNNGSPMIARDHAIANALSKRPASKHFKLAGEDFGSKSRTVAISEKDFNVRIRIFEKVGHSTYGAPSARGAYKCVQFALSLAKNFRSSAIVMSEEVGDIVELVGVDSPFLVGNALCCYPVVCGIDDAIASNRAWQQLMLRIGLSVQKHIATKRMHNSKHTVKHHHLAGTRRSLRRTNASNPVFL